MKKVLRTLPQTLHLANYLGPISSENLHTFISGVVHNSGYIPMHVFCDINREALDMHTHVL